MKHSFLLNAGQVRTETRNGRKYLVAPTTIIVSGVLPGSAGSLYYPPEEVKTSTEKWNGMPLVLEHPVQDDGTMLSGQLPEVFAKQGLGTLHNVQWQENKQRIHGEAWFDAQKTKELSPKVYKSLRNGKKIEVSTGLIAKTFTAAYNSTCPRTGRSYTHVAKSYRPDHLAILENVPGACSVEDGCGVFNQLSPQEGVFVANWAAGPVDIKNCKATKKPGPCAKTGSKSTRKPTREETSANKNVEAIKAKIAALQKKIDATKKAMKPAPKDKSKPVEPPAKKVKVTMKSLDEQIAKSKETSRKAKSPILAKQHMAASYAFSKVKDAIKAGDLKKAGQLYKIGLDYQSGTRKLPTVGSKTPVKNSVTSLIVNSRCDKSLVKKLTESQRQALLSFSRDDVLDTVVVNEILRSTIPSGKTPMTRDDAIEKLVTNCDCSKKKLEKISNRGIKKLMKFGKTDPSEDVMNMLIETVLEAETKSEPINNKKNPVSKKTPPVVKVEVETEDDEEEDEVMNKFATAEEWFAAAPEEVQAVFNAAKKVTEEVRTELVTNALGQLPKHLRKISEPVFNAMDIKALQALVKDGKKAQVNNSRQDEDEDETDYSGAGNHVNNNRFKDDDDGDDVLLLPTYDYTEQSVFNRKKNRNRDDN